MAEGSLKSEDKDECNLEEPLLDHVDLSSNSEAKVRGCDTVTPYENAGIFGTLAFSWLTPLLALGVKKTTLDLDDLPQLGTSNSVFGAFPIFKDKLLKSLSPVHNIGAHSSRVAATEFGLVKAYFLSVWEDMTWTALLGIIYTLSRYVSPYLIDNFIQCLNDREKFKSQGYILAFTFCATTFFAVFIRKHLVFKMQQLGIRIRAVTTVMIYNKCLTLPSRSSTLQGITTIRSFDQESRFQPTYMKIVDSYSRPEFHLAAAMKWLLLRLDAFSCITFAFLLVFLLFFAERIDPAIAGLAVTYGLTLSGKLSALIWCLCNWETKMISVERILQYITIPSEGPLTIQENRPDCSWPSHGEIFIQNLHVRYAPHLPLVLHGVTCTFSGGMKTGIVGRTGSGKSTLIQALFRIVEPTTGRIVIDSIDISSIGLKDLRSRLSIIPQDPTMFQGTVRSNLDPLEQYTDEQIWVTLDKCQLGDEVRKMEKKLDSNVHENGENWSMGQRQLVCLGRVLLKKSKVLILDEATASVDTATDNLIQLTLKRYFSDCTLITIAHRITSILDSDMILLLSHGLVEEYDSPTRLLQIKSSSFTKLVAEYTTRCSNSNAHFIDLSIRD